MQNRANIDIPFSVTSVSQQLSLMQQRCGELAGETDRLELSLEGPASAINGGDPYNNQGSSKTAVFR